MDFNALTSLLPDIDLSDPFGVDKTAPVMRKTLQRLAPHMELPVPAMVATQDVSYPGETGSRAARLYVPEGGEPGGPGVLFLHGGGYVVGGIDTHDGLCGRLAKTSGLRVVSLDYRLAPEHPFPDGVADVLAGFDWLRGDGAKACGIDPDRLAVAGDSAGGGLAAMLGQQRRDQVRFQLLIYPLMQLVEPRKPKLKALEGHMLSVTALEQIVDAYIPDDQDPADTRISPLFEDDLSGLAPVYMAAAELDPLFDEGQAYRDRLIASGVPCDYVLGKALPHGYFSMTAILPGAKSLVDKAGYALGAAMRA